MRAQKTPSKARQQDNFREDTVLALLRQGLTVTALATRIARPRSSVSRAIHHKQFPRLRDAIAAELGL